MIRVPFFVKNYERTGVWAINRAPAKLVGLWEEEQTRASSICSANSYDKRIATSERSEVGALEGTTNIAYLQENNKKVPILLLFYSLFCNFNLCCA